MQLQSNHHHEQGRILLQIARAAITHALKATEWKDESAGMSAQWLQQAGATFITLTQHGRLRGCIGSLQAHQPLVENVCSNAVSAALYDTRFLPVTSDELESIDIEISLLSALQPIQFANESDALKQLRPGVDGMILEYGVCRSTFLPQVWDNLPQPREFLAQLKVKAGLYPDFWHDTIRLSRYTVQKWRETDFIEEKNHG
ncbi:MAG: AmmeMemoRadiSam system protein A [Nitrosomonas sp.]|nr:AmmeMemoRadiSam system protein A [Nitrosomonas sp.]MCW5618887.1 AmmeMemoRadiSam system protein A [Nitrosomonas sp.]